MTETATITRSQDNVTSAVRTKRCLRCRQVKPIHAFEGNKRTSDGLACHCKDCVQQGARARTVKRAVRETAPDAQAAQVKASARLREQPRSVAGLHDICSTDGVDHIGGEAAFKGRGSKDGASENITIIGAWDQAESLIREMAEVQAEIDAEREVCKTRIVAAEDYFEEIAGQLRRRQDRLGTVIADFVRRNRSDLQANCRKLRFGVLWIEDGETRIELHAKYAGAMVERP